MKTNDMFGSLEIHGLLRGVSGWRLKKRIFGRVFLALFSEKIFSELPEVDFLW